MTRENCLRWFDHVKRIPINALIKKWAYSSQGNAKGKWKPKITLVEVVKMTC